MDIVVKYSLAYRYGDIDAKYGIPAYIRKNTNAQPTSNAKTKSMCVPL